MPRAPTIRKAHCHCHEQRAQHLQKVHQEHQDIFGAIERHDPEAARAAMRIHLVNSRERQRLAHADPSSGGVPAVA